MKELSESKSSSSSTSSPSNRTKVSRYRENPKLELATRVSSQSAGKPKPISSDSVVNPKIKRSIFSNKVKLDGEIMTGVSPVEKYVRIRRKPDENEAKIGDLKKRVDESEIMVKDMSLEISCLKEEIEKLRKINVVLEEQNKKLADDLLASEIKIVALDSHNQAASAGKEGEPSELSRLQQHSANKLDPITRDETVDKKSINSQIQFLPINPGAKTVQVKSNILINTPLRSPPPPPPCPPPPPPPRLHPKNEGKAQKATSLVEFYHCLTKRDTKGNVNCSNQVASSVHNSIVGELQNRSAHLLAIKGDVETKGEFIKQLINRVQSAAFMNMDDALTFVDWFDGELSKLADERAVLKHFNWPETKADALREAAVEYREIRQLYVEVSSFVDDASLTCDIILRKIANLVERSERNVQRLIKLRGTALASYQSCKIPTDWMIDSGMINMIKVASVRLAKIYIMRLLTEHDLSWQIERKSAQESLLSQGVRFVYRVYQFVGGLDSETMRAFEELRSRVQWRESRDFMQNQMFVN